MTKSRKSQADLDLEDVNDTYAGLRKQSFGLQPAATTLDVRGFGKQHRDMLALQKQSLALANTGNQQHSRHRRRRRRRGRLSAQQQCFSAC